MQSQFAISQRVMMDHVHLMNVFVAVGEDESFAAAARRLDLSPAAITRAVAALEARLGVKLLLRTTRSVRLTEAGRRYLDDARNILASIAAANEAVVGINASPRGNLSVTASVLFGKAFVMPSIVQFLKQYPEVEVSAVFLDSAVNLMEDGIDVAVRVGHLPDSSLKALRVGQVRRVLCASPDYLRRYGIPRHPSDLRRHTTIAATGGSRRAEWKFGADESTLVRTTPRLTVTSNDSAVEAAIAGVGVCRFLSYMVSKELERGRLKIVLEEYEEAPWPVHVLHRESRLGSSKVRSFIDLLVDQLRSHQHLNGANVTA